MDWKIMKEMKNKMWSKVVYNEVRYLHNIFIDTILMLIGNIKD